MNQFWKTLFVATGIIFVWALFVTWAAVGSTMFVAALPNFLILFSGVTLFLWVCAFLSYRSSK